MRKLLLFLSVIVLTISAGTCFSQPVESLVHDRNNYVDDYAGTYTPEQKMVLGSIIKSFFDTVQIALVTVKTLNGQDVQEYATKLFNKWGVGSKSNNGLLILIAPSERKAFAATGRAIQGDLTDLMAARLQREVMVPEFKKGDYYAGTKILLLAYIKTLSPSAKEYNKKQNEALEAASKREVQSIVQVLGAIVVCIIISVLISLWNKKKKREADDKKRRSEALHEKFEEVYRKIRSFCNSFDKTLPSAGMIAKPLEEIAAIVEFKNDQDKQDYINKWDSFINKYEAHILDYQRQFAQKNEAQMFVELLDDSCFSKIRAKIEDIQSNVPKLIFESVPTERVSGLMVLSSDLYSLREQLSSDLKNNAYGSLSALCQKVNEQKKKLDSEISTINSVIMRDAYTAGKARNGAEEINLLLMQAGGYCQKPGVSQGAIDTTNKSIEDIRSRLSGYEALSIVAQYALYQQLLSKIESSCYFAKKEYEKIQAQEEMERQRIATEQRRKRDREEEDERSRCRASNSYEQPTSYVSMNNNNDDSFKANNDIGGGTFGGGTTDGGGGGASW